MIKQDIQLKVFGKQKEEEKPPTSHSKSRKNTSKFHQFIHYGLKQKLRCWILSPLFIGIVITVAISFTIVLYVEPTWFQITGSEIVKNQQNSMQSISGSISDYMEEYLQRIVNDILFIHNYTQKVITKEGYYYLDSKKSNAYPLLNSTKEPYSTQINNNPLRNMGNFSWYINDNIVDPSHITDPNTLDNMKIAANLEIVVRPIFRNSYRLMQWENKSSYVSIFHIFDNDGLLYTFPCPSSSLKIDFFSIPMNQTCSDEKKAAGLNNITCAEFYIATKFFAENNQGLLTILPPFQYTRNNDTGLGLICCHATMTDATHMRMATCIYADISDLAFHLENSSAIELGELTLIEYNAQTIGIVILRGGNNLLMSDFFKNENRTSLMYWEFGEEENSTNQEVLYFQKSFNNSMALKYNDTYIDIYQRKGSSYLLALIRVNIKTGYDSSQQKDLFTLMFTISQDKLLLQFESVKDDIKSRLLTQLLIIGAVVFVILIISLQTINYIANSIVSPMDDLVRKVRKMQDGDDEVEIIENFTEKSYEINCLYVTFSKLANVLKYANKAFFDGNDAEALIRYAQALRLFSDLNNRKAMASIYNNIGNIHLLGERYEEAIENYRQSVEITEEEFKKASKLSKGRTLNSSKRGKPSDANRRSNSSGYSNLHYSLKNEAKKSNSSSYRDSKRSTVGPQSLAETKVILETQIANRQYQLVNSLIIQAEKRKINNWDEITKRLNKVLQIDFDHKKNISRIVKTHLLISNAFLEIGDFKKSFQHIVSAEEKLRVFKEIYIYYRIHLLKEYTNMYTQGLLSEREIPPDILNQKVYLQKGMILKKIGRTRAAAQKFTDCLEIGTVYDPDIRRKCLEELKGIFESKDLLDQAPNIPKLLENTVSKKNKDIVFALDYSESMTQPGRLKHATKAIVTIYDDYIKDNDRVGFIRFNKNVDVIFGLSERGKNRVYLRKCLQNVEEVIKPHGETAFFTAIKEALKLHKKAERRDHSRWIVALTDGEDNSSRIKYEEIYKKLKNSDINLIIVGLALDEKIIPLLRELCLATTEGVFIETPVSNDLDIAFQSITDIIYGTSDLIIESWS